MVFEPSSYLPNNFSPKSNLVTGEILSKQTDKPPILLGNLNRPNMFDGEFHNNDGDLYSV